MSTDQQTEDLSKIWSALSNGQRSVAKVLAQSAFERVKATLFSAQSDVRVLREALEGARDANPTLSLQPDTIDRLVAAASRALEYVYASDADKRQLTVDAQSALDRLASLARNNVQDTIHNLRAQASNAATPTNLSELEKNISRPFPIARSPDIHQLLSPYERASIDGAARGALSELIQLARRAQFSAYDVLLVSRSLLRTSSSHAAREAALRLQHQAMALEVPPAPKSPDPSPDPQPVVSNDSSVPGTIGEPTVQGLNVGEWRSIAMQLWQLLDAVDTLGDQLKPLNSSYFNRVERILKKRFDLLASDGHNLFPATPRSDPQPAEASNLDAELRLRLIRQVSQDLRTHESSGSAPPLVAVCLDYLLRVAHPPVLNDLAERVAKLEAAPAP